MSLKDIRKRDLLEECHDEVNWKQFTDDRRVLLRLLDEAREAIRQITMRAHTPDGGKLNMDRMLSEIADIGGEMLLKLEEK